MGDYEYYDPGSLLALTGQEHDEDFKYDKVLALYKGIRYGVTQKDFEGSSASVGCIGAVGFNLKENRIVDIAVHPRFRRLGIGKLLVKMSECTVAYSASIEANKFWDAIGWVYCGHIYDKNVLVRRWMTGNRATEAHMR